MLKEDFEPEDLEKDFENELGTYLSMNSKEDVLALLQSFKENLTSKIIGYETNINQSLTRDQKTRQEILDESLLKRNRSIILEIEVTMERFSKEQKAKFSAWRKPVSE